MTDMILKANNGNVTETIEELGFLYNLGIISQSEMDNAVDTVLGFRK